MSAPSSAPRGERAPRPGATWETQLILHGEIVVDTSSDVPRFLDREPAPPAPESAAASGPRPNRATRRALARATRKENRRA